MGFVIGIAVISACSGESNSPPPSPNPGIPTTTALPTTQQGPRLRPNTPFPNVDTVAISTDGNTILTGNPNESLGQGASWVFTRTASVWMQQGPTLIGSDAVGDLRNPVRQGSSVALSGDGNTALVGGPGDNDYTGAVWVFSRINGVWTQQGPKLVAIASPNLGQGVSVALSADGTTAAIGAPGDNGNRGTVIIFARTGDIWRQQARLIGTGNAGPANIGSSVALNSDGTTLVAGGPVDDHNFDANASIGAVWVFSRKGDVWTQDGPKLVGKGIIATPASPHIGQGASVAVSADGSTVLIGGPGDNGSVGAAWVFTRSVGEWTQQGPKLVPTGFVTAPPSFTVSFGSSVALSGDGNIALVGAPGDDTSKGAAWFFARDGAVWTQHGSKLLLTPPSSSGPLSYGRCVALSSDGTTAAVVGDGITVYVH
jgi:hypothetical protein